MAETPYPTRKSPNMALLRPKFSLSRTIESNLAITRDENPSVFLKRVEKQLTQAQAFSNAVESTTPKNIATMLRSMDIDIASENGQQKLRELTAALKLLSTAINNDSDGNTTSNREQREEKAGRQYRPPSPPGRPPDSDPQYVHGTRFRFESLASTLENINTLLTDIETREKQVMRSCPRIVHPPWTRNGMLTSCGIAYLHPLDASLRAEKSAGVFFVVHKSILWINSRRLFDLTTSKKHHKILEIDTDERTVEFVVHWLYYRDIPSRLDENQLCKIALVAIGFQIPKLHNKIVTRLLDRHMPHPDHKQERFPNFRPCMSLLRKLFQATEKNAPMRQLVSYLLARAYGGSWTSGSDETWALSLKVDIENWLWKWSIVMEEMLKDNPAATEQQAKDEFRDGTFFVKEM